MKAQIKPRMQMENRPVLEEHIPLTTPFIINVDPSDRCNLGCIFCPTGDRELMKATPGRNSPYLSFNLFKKIVTDIGQFDRPISVLRLYKDGEPLANPYFSEMVKHAKQSGCCKVVDTTTNAVLLTAKRTDAILEAGLDRMNISIYGMDPEQYLRFTKRQVDFNQLVAQIRYLYEQNERSGKRLTINIKINSDVISSEARRKFYDTFGNLCHEINDEHVMPCWSGFDYEAHGVSVNPALNIYGTGAPQERSVCPYVFYSFSINSDGTASACFLDWERKRIIGDVNTESVVGIWQGAQLQFYQELMLRGERKHHLPCANCGQMSHGTPDNLDPHREKLLAKFLGKR